MANVVRAALDVARESTPQVLIGALFLVLLLSVSTACIHRLVGRRVSDPLAALAALLMVTNLGAILVGVGYARSTAPIPTGPSVATIMPGSPERMPGTQVEKAAIGAPRSLSH